MELHDPLARYFARIGLAAPVAVTPGGLAQMQAAHRQAIPFENLSIPLGEGMACERAPVFAKLVEVRRGGFCFEHNRLFADMLEAAGFAARLLLARVLLGDPPELPPRTHCLVLVRFGAETWIADAGFGGAYAPPMPLVDGARAVSGDGAQHRLRHLGPEGALPGAWLLERQGPMLATDGRAQSDSAWEAQYVFDLAEVAPADMALGCHWSTTHPASRFTNLTVVSRCLPDGFVSLTDRALTRWRKDMPPERRALASPAEYGAVLEAEFGLVLAEDEVARLPLF
ncbi:arylamine N-acetyltransferase family protein [Erythrobacter sp. EC-HK427]|uniref:arylamine N-acetyltransferase family protein n=1 Tax=Erythrobacter sp. EC-HK427 TaxID=2038396 RepID=UPI0012511CBE|nr:arylamine N-acetyltransferase [Erythrobacter sp. EC-HK427]VVT05810.1 conserved hypothetical protein [Erythrobacter sp. EC-HK427]